VKKTYILFELNTRVDLHELLCKAIHEEDVNALRTLNATVDNIVQPLRAVKGGVKLKRSKDVR
jgi:hypothetical protein